MSERYYSCGWLAPDGFFTQCPWCDHIASADEIVAEKFPDLEFKWDTHADDVLLDHGYVKISMSIMMGDYFITWDFDKHLTNAQKEFLKPYFESGDIEVDEFCVREWNYEKGGNL